MAEDPVMPDFDAQAAAIAANGIQGGTAQDKIDSMNVYMGMGQRPVGQLQQSRETAGKGLPDTRGQDKSPIYRSVGDVSTEYFRFDYKTRSDFINALKGLGQDTSKMNDADFASAWRAYTVQAAQQTTNGKNMSPWDVLALDLLTREKQRQDEVQKGPKTTTATQTATDLSTQLDAKAILYQASQTLLGRAPTDTETSNFWSNLNQQESANPQVTTTTTTTAPTGELINQEQVRSGGMSADAKQMLVMDEAKKNPEYGAYQVATKFQDALMGLVYGKGY
jgi:hypothetical protein